MLLHSITDCNQSSFISNDTHLIKMEKNHHISSISITDLLLEPPFPLDSDTLPAISITALRNRKAGATLFAINIAWLSSAYE